jgi:hypothetical protein
MCGGIPEAKSTGTVMIPPPQMYYLSVENYYLIAFCITPISK